MIAIDSGFRVYTKGASEGVLERCNSYMNEFGQILPLDPTIMNTFVSLIVVTFTEPLLLLSKIPIQRSKVKPKQNQE